MVFPLGAGFVSPAASRSGQPSLPSWIVNENRQDEGMSANGWQVEEVTGLKC